MGINIEELYSYETSLSSQESFASEVRDLSEEELKLTGGSSHINSGSINPGRALGFSNGNQDSYQGSNAFEQSEKTLSHYDKAYASENRDFIYATAIQRFT